MIIASGKDLLKQPGNKSVRALVVTWVLMIPLFYFASGGSFWFYFSGRASFLYSAHGGIASLQTVNNQERVVVLLVFILALVPILSRIPSILEIAQRHSLFAVLALLALFSSAWSQFPKDSFVYSVFIIFDTLFAFYLYQRFNSSQLLLLLMTCGWACLALSIVLAMFCPMYGLDPTLNTEGWRGSYSNKNPCAEMTIVFLSVALFSPALSLASRFGRMMFVAFSIFVVLMTQSGTGKILLIALLYYVIVIRVIGRATQKERAFVLTMVTTFSFLLVIGGISYSSEITYLLGKDPTLTGRTEIWKAVLTPIMKRPLLGYGYGGFWKGNKGESASVMLPGGFIPLHAHNGFLEVWLELGALGLVIVLYSFIRALRNWFACIAARRGDLNWCGCVVFLVAVYAMDEPALMRANDLTWILYIIACLGLADGARSRQSGVERE